MAPCGARPPSGSLLRVARAAACFVVWSSTSTPRAASISVLQGATRSGWASVGDVGRHHGADSEQAAFDDFVARYGRGYVKGSPEYQERFALFRRALAEVNAVNEDPQSTWTAGINHFSDQTDAERRRVLGYRRSRAPGAAYQPPSLLQQERTTVPDRISFKNLTSSSWIMNQGMCGSCWAMTTAGLLDTHYELNYGSTRNQFSPQELVSCVANPHHCGGKGGCDGATVELGMEYAVRHGLTDLHKAPYAGSSGQCHRRGVALAEDLGGSKSASAGGRAFGLRTWRKLGTNSEGDLLRALMTGPVGVSVDGGTWYSYDSGLFKGCKRNSIVNHAVVLFGYRAGDEGFWHIRNSWGPSWGEEGFIRLARSKNEEELCGVDDEPQQGTGCDGGPPKVTVCGACGILYDNVVPEFVPPADADSLAAQSDIAIGAQRGDEAESAAALVRREWREDVPPRA